MAAEYLNHWRSGDEIHVRRFADRASAERDVGIAIHESVGDADDYSLTLWVARDARDEIVAYQIQDLRAAGQEYADEMKRRESDPYPPSMIGRAAA